MKKSDASLVKVLERAVAEETELTIEDLAKHATAADELIEMKKDILKLIGIMQGVVSKR